MEIQMNPFGNNDDEINISNPFDEPSKNPFGDSQIPSNPFGVPSSNPFGDEDEYIEALSENFHPPHPPTSISGNTPSRPLKPPKITPGLTPVRPLKPTVYQSSEADNSLKDLANEKTAVGLSRGNALVHQNRFSDFWMITFFIIYIGQYSVMLSVGVKILENFNFYIILGLVILVIILILVARSQIRSNVKKRHRTDDKLIHPDDEADMIPDLSIYLLSLAGVLVGITYALYSSLIAGKDQGVLSSRGFFTGNTMVQAVRFASITILAFHRMLRPSNRVDPLRTMLELEVVSVCWDALDGSTLMELLEGTTISGGYEVATRTLMAFWYLSVGFRIAVMFFTSLTVGSWGHDLVLSHPLEISPHPTVDRTLQAMRLRALVILVMAPADFFAGALRLALWSEGLLNSLQQEMAIKNVMFLTSVYGAYAMRASTVLRDWNSRNLGFGFYIPSRNLQMELARYVFVIFYLLEGLLLSVILINVTNDRNRWVANIIFDVILVAIFLVYCRNVHVHRVHDIPRFFLKPQDSFVMFPTKFACILSILMLINLFAARLPGLYLSYSSMANDDTGDLWTFNNSILIVLLAVIPISAGGLFWSIAYMLFKSEFTSSPGNYNAIHDPTINMVATATQVEGALDVLSCVSFLSLASANLPSTVNYFCIIFALLELVNACQCFGLQALLSGGHDDTPLDLVKFKAYLRAIRCVIDFLSLIFRVILWVQFEAISSVFLIKNLYNLLHGGAQVERWRNASKYPKYTLFTEHVPPQDWYGLNKEEWREATRLTIADQARIGRTV